MLSKKRVTLPKLISYILSFTTDTTDNDNILENVFSNQMKSNDEFKFNCLNVGESKNINDFPEKLKTIFDPFIKDFIRHGSKTTFDNDVNLSLFYSVLSCVVSDFRTFSTSDQLNFINKLREKIIIFLTNEETFKNYDYEKQGWVKKDIINSFVLFKTNKLVLKVLADYLNINIFVLNILEDKIYVVSENDSYDMFRSSIFLAFNTDTFEPLIYLNNTTLDYTSAPVKKLINVDKNLLILMNTNMTNDAHINFNLKVSNLERYITKASDKKEIVNKEIQSETKNTNIEMTEGIDNEYGEVMVEESEEPEKTETKLEFHISPKMKKDELQDIAKKLGIAIEKDGAKKKIPKTNNELINEIKNKLKKA